MILLKWKQWDLEIFSCWHLPFFNVPSSTFQKKKKMKHWNSDIIGYWVIGAGCWIEKNQQHSHSTPNCSKDIWKVLLLISLNWPHLVTCGCGSKIYSKMHPGSCNNTHHDNTELVNHDMVKNTKTLTSWEQNITFLWNKKILNLNLRWHILRSYHFK